MRSRSRPGQTPAADSLTQAEPPWLRRSDRGVLLRLHVQPGARRTQVVGVHADRLKIALQAPPIDGRANDALLKYLAAHLGLRRSALQLTAGATSRDKTVAIEADEDGRRAIAASLVPDAPS